jgi:hypothetical protein
MHGTHVSVLAQLALSACDSHPVLRSVRPIGPRVTKSILVARGFVPPTLAVSDLKELQRRMSVDGFASRTS